MGGMGRYVGVGGVWCVGVPVHVAASAVCRSKDFENILGTCRLVTVTKLKATELENSIIYFVPYFLNPHFTFNPVGISSQ